MSRTLALLALAIALALAATAQTAFTYQGRLEAGGAPAHGTYDMLFTLYDAPTGEGRQAYAPRTVIVTNGVFTASLPFADSLNGDPRWLEIAVRPVGSQGDYTPILPRQNITPSPYAITAFSVAPNSVTSAGLANDPTSLAKISGGVMTSAGGVTIAPAIGIGDLLLVRTRWNSAEAADQHAGYGSGTQYGQPTAIEPNGWQSFQPGVMGTLMAVDLRTAGSGTGMWAFTLEVREGEGAGGALLASTTVSGGTLETATHVTFATPPLLQANTTYSLVFANVPTANPKPKLNGWYDQYARGRSNWSATYDFAFDTYMRALNTATPFQVAGGAAWGVGIGAAPANGYRFDVAGSLRATGFNLPTGAAQGKVLTASGDGTGTWQALPTPPSTLPPSGAASGDLAGSYPNPVIGDGKVTSAKLASDATSLAKVTADGMAMNGSNVGIGTTTAGQRLQVDGGNALIRGGNNFQNLYTLNPPTTTPGSASLYLGDTSYFVRAVRGQGLTFGASGTANVSVDTFGNMNIADPSKLKFGSSTRQMVNLYGTTYGLGVQANTLYQRSAGGFAWFKGGTHSDTANGPGTGGAALMTLGSDGRLGLGTAASSPAYLLHVKGSQTGNWATPMARIENTNATGDSGPALSVVGSANTPDGVLNIAAGATGKVIALGSTAAGGEVASVDVNGNLNLLGGVSAIGNIATAGTMNAKNGITTTGNITALGSISARNLPAAAYSQRTPDAGSLDFRDDTFVTLGDVTVNIPGPGRLVVQGFVQLRGLNIDEFSLSSIAGRVKLDDATAYPATLLTEAAVGLGDSTVPIIYVMDIAAPQTKRLKLIAEVYGDRRMLVRTSNLTAMYFPNTM